MILSFELPLYNYFYLYSPGNNFEYYRAACNPDKHIIWYMGCPTGDDPNPGCLISYNYDTKVQLYNVSVSNADIEVNYMAPWMYNHGANVYTNGWDKNLDLFFFNSFDVNTGILSGPSNTFAKDSACALFNSTIVAMSGDSLQFMNANNYELTSTVTQSFQYCYTDNIYLYLFDVQSSSVNLYAYNEEGQAQFRIPFSPNSTMNGFRPSFSYDTLENIFIYDGQSILYRVPINTPSSVDSFSIADSFSKFAGVDALSNIYFIDDSPSVTSKESIYVQQYSPDMSGAKLLQFSVT
ncbi:MAG: hypothetical protein NXI00_23840, partial [Cytophagales bacterium]|nr:hypothetical protein [Cytophagales bacterium]